MSTPAATAASALSNASTASAPPADIARAKAMRHAASMLVLRDGPAGMEILMMRRPAR